MSEIDDDRIGVRAVPLRTDQYLRWNEDTSRLFIVCNMARPFTGRFVRTLEHEHYPPSDPVLNDKLELAICEGFAGIPWIVLGIPLGERSRADAVCKKLKLRLANGFPFVYPVGKVNMLGASREPPAGSEIFPLHSRRTYTLEELHPGVDRSKGILVGAVNQRAAMAAWAPIRAAMDRNQARTN
jgi:hypothetical protein